MTILIWDFGNRVSALIKYKQSIKLFKQIIVFICIFLDFAVHPITPPSVDFSRMLFFSLLLRTCVKCLQRQVNTLINHEWSIWEETVGVIYSQNVVKSVKTLFVCFCFGKRVNSKSCLTFVVPTDKWFSRFVIDCTSSALCVNLEDFIPRYM